MKPLIFTPEVAERFKEISECCMGEAQAYCVAECPMHTDVKGYVKLISEAKFDEALSRIRETLFLPATLGRICAHPCEGKCKRGELNQPMSIAALKRFVADRCDAESRWSTRIEPEKNRSIAIIGAGPAGAQAALDLRKKGYRVTVFDRLPVIGGMLRVGIPQYRLPRHILEFEYRYLEVLGVEFRLGVEIGKDLSFEQLRKDFDVVLIAAGAHNSMIVPVDGHGLGGVLGSVEFLRRVSLNGSYPIGSKVVVIGGGNVAIDVARSAVRVGAREVHLVCLESRSQMPAHGWEIEEAEQEGIVIHCGYGPEKIHGHNGRVSGFEAKRCISVFDAGGAFNPSFDETETILFSGVDNVIFAIGQSVDNSFVPSELFEFRRGGRFSVDPVTLQTRQEAVFAAGDATGRSVIAIEAMAEGRKAAESIDRYLSGRDLYADRPPEGSFKTRLETSIGENETDLPRVLTRTLTPEERIHSFQEVDQGFTEEQAMKEASRCLQCECGHCMKECEMLGRLNQHPGSLFKTFLENGRIDPLIPYSCNMCRQCTLVCPKQFSMMDRFMDIRLKLVEANNGKSPIKGHGAIEIHQKLGFSRLFNTTKPAPKPLATRKVFIPGCSLPSYHPDAVEHILGFLRQKMPGTGCILKCCGKPTKALGQKDLFRRRYARLQEEIDRLGAEEIIVACQSCYVTIREYSPKQKVRSLWQVLPETGLPERAAGKGKGSDIVIAVHDSCPTRDHAGIHDGIRWIIHELGYRIEEPAHTRSTTRCCGFGGMVVPANPDLAVEVMRRRTREVESDYMVTYCAACRESMVRAGKKAVHILDLIFGPVWTSSSQYPGLPDSPVTSWANRYKAKRRIIKVA